MLKSLRSLPVWLLGLASFFNDSASELVYPLVPLYLASVLMAGPKALGLIEGIAEATGSLLKLFTGVMADRLRATKYWAHRRRVGRVADLVLEERIGTAWGWFNLTAGALLSAFCR